MRASYAMKMRSEQSARSVPPPTHQPCTWAITGLRDSHSDMKARTLRDTIRKSGTGRRGGRHREVVAGAEGATGAPQDDHPHLRLAVGPRHRLLQPADERHIDGVQPLRPVDRDEGQR